MSELMQELEQLGGEHLETIHTLIDRVLSREVGQEGSLTTMTRYHMSTGGKRLRALLPLAVAKAMGVEPSTLIPFGAACELLHNATLVHDDLQDGDRVRRGQPTIWVEYGAARAINLGDAMLYATMLLADELELDVALRHQAMTRIARETLRVVDGQEREFLLKELERPDASDYFAMVEGKTSGLFALPVAGAAALCGASDELLSALQEVTRHLGVVFQIQDDVLDLYGDKGREQPGSDIGEGKISMLVVHALHHSDENDAIWLRGLLRREREDVLAADVQRASDLFKSSGAVKAAFDEIDRRASIAAKHPELEKYPELHALITGMAEVFLAPIESVREKLLAP